jgi:hypothetical protein
VLAGLWAANRWMIGDAETFRLTDATPDPVTPEPEPMPIPSVFGPGGGLNLSVVNDIILDFHQLQRVIDGVRERRVAALRKKMESSMGLSRRRAVDQGEIYNAVSNRTMSRDRKVEDISAIRKAGTVASSMRAIYNQELQDIEPYRKAKLLHAHTFKITNCDPTHGPTHEGNHPGILQNSILVDSFRSYPYNEMRTQTGRLPRQGKEILPGAQWSVPVPWDETATITERHRGKLVKTRNSGRTQNIHGIDGNVSGNLPD